jgi:hypothetical protein
MNAMLECSNRDIAAAGMWQDQIKKILKAHQQGERNNAMLRDIKVLCICIIHTIRDPYCQEKMCEVAIQSDKLFAVGERAGAGRSMLSIFLRRLIFKSLQAFDDRLRALETTRQSDHRASGTNAARFL